MDADEIIILMLAEELNETLGYCVDGIDVRSDDNIGG